MGLTALTGLARQASQAITESGDSLAIDAETFQTLLHLASRAPGDRAEAAGLLALAQSAARLGERAAQPLLLQLFTLIAAEVGQLQADRAAGAARVDGWARLRRPGPRESEAGELFDAALPATLTLLDQPRDARPTPRSPVGSGGKHTLFDFLLGRGPSR